jgi:3-dehydroquinate synthase class II
MEKLVLVKARVTKVKRVGMGDRVCVDTTSLMVPSESTHWPQSNGHSLALGI